MMLRNALLSGSLAASIVRAAQPEAAKPVAAPMRDLVWGQVNFLHTTDTHAWLSGHLQESVLDPETIYACSREPESVR